MDAISGEDFFKLGDLPIMVCVLQFEEDSWTLGYSVSRLASYDDEFARACARRSALIIRRNYEERREQKRIARAAE